MTTYVHGQCGNQVVTADPRPIDIFCRRCGVLRPAFEWALVPSQRPVLVGSISMPTKILRRGPEMSGRPGSWEWVEMAAKLAFDSEGRCWWLVVRVETTTRMAHRYVTRTDKPIRWELAEDLPFIWDRPKNLPEERPAEDAKNTEG
jgi:hypothetical protein